METNGERLRGRVLDLTERLSDAARLVNESSASAVNELDRIDQQLNARAASLREVLDRVVLEATDASGILGERIETMRDTAGHSSTDIAALSEQFDAQAASLATAARAVGVVNQRIEQGLSERESRLAEVSAKVATEVESLEGRVRGMAQDLETTLGRAQDRSLEASKALSEAARSVEQALDQRIETLRDTAVAKGQDVSDAIRAAYEATVGDISQALDQAIGRFSDSAGEMRGVSQSIRAELENTRELLRTGAIEIPKEAEEGARSMRRVVSEQIKALRELSNIADRQAGRIDLGSSDTTPGASVRRDTGTSEPRAPEPKPIERERVSTTRQTSRGEERETLVTPSITTPPRSETPRADASRRPAPALEDPALSQDLEAALRESLAQPRPALRATEGRAGGENAPAEPAARTRREVPSERTPVHMVESLNSLSVDIARAIDHDAFMSLWERYKEGERNVFTRRLYTLQGQKTYDDIRRRYARDREFRTAVERYLEDFENLLRQVAKDDPNGSAAQDYLMSETGKVYTMLAHTSGRLS